MKIEREIREKVSEQDGVTFYQGKIITVELTGEEIEQAFRIQQARYLEEDIRQGIEDFCEYEEIDANDVFERNADGHIMQKIQKLYEKNESMEVAQRDTIIDSIREVLKEEGML